MKKRLISLSLISFASVLSLSACTQVASNVNQPQVVQNDGDHRDLPHYRADELPEDDVVYDLTKEQTYKDIKPATKEEFEEFLISIVGPSLINVVKETFPDLYDYIVEYNVFTERELYDLASVGSRILKITQGQEVDPTELVIDIASKLDLDKIYHLFSQIRNNPKSYEQVKRLTIAIANSTFYQLDYRAADAYLKSVSSPERCSDQADDEKIVWDNFLVNGDDLEIFETISDFFHNPDIRVFLRFVNLLARSLTKNLTRHELGFIFTSFGLIQDEEYAELCYRYMMNNADSFVKHLGNIIKGIHITDDSWMMMLKGLLHIANINNGDSHNWFEGDDYIAVDYLKEQAWAEQIQNVYDSIDPHGIRILLKFIGNVLSSMPKSIVTDIMRNTEDPTQIDVVAIKDLYLEQYGRLTGSEKEALDAQCEIFGIDLDDFNTHLDPEQFNPEEDTPFDFLMDLLNNNLIGPFMEYFTTAISMEPIYPDYDDIEISEMRSGNVKLVLRQGDKWTDEDLMNYINNDSSFHTYFRITNHAAPTQSTYFDDRQYRNSWNIEGEIDTSKVGEYYIIVGFKVDIDAEMYKAPEYTEIETRRFTYNFKWKLKYYVIDKSINDYAAGFKNQLGRYINGNYSDKGYDCCVDSNGEVAYVDYRGLIYVKQNGNYAANELCIEADTYSAHHYDADLKRYVDIEDEGGIDRSGHTVKYVSDLDTSTLGLHYGIYKKLYRKYVGGTEHPYVDYCEFTMVYAYYVVEDLNVTVDDGFFDPGFGW